MSGTSIVKCLQLCRWFGQSWPRYMCTRNFWLLNFVRIMKDRENSAAFTLCLCFHTMQHTTIAITFLLLVCLSKISLTFFSLRWISNRRKYLLDILIIWRPKNVFSDISLLYLEAQLATLWVRNKSAIYPRHDWTATREESKVCC